MPETEVDPAQEAHEDNGAPEGARVKRKADGLEATKNEPTIAAWKRWLQGPFQTIMADAKLREQAAEWTISLMEDMAEDKVLEGAVPALVLRAGMDMDKEQAITALAVYRERLGLRPDFVRGMFVPCAAGRGPKPQPQRRAKY